MSTPLETHTDAVSDLWDFMVHFEDDVDLLDRTALPTVGQQERQHDWTSLEVDENEDFPNGRPRFLPGLWGLVQARWLRAASFAATDPQLFFQRRAEDRSSTPPALHT
jgi:hypothetical protein